MTNRQALPFRFLAYGLAWVLATFPANAASPASEPTTPSKERGVLGPVQPKPPAASGWENLLASTLVWETSPPLVFPEHQDDSLHIAYKNPSVVQAKGGWHVFASRKSYVNNRIRHSMVYVGFPDWQRTKEARVVPLLTDEPYASAPCVFYYRPHQKWYVFYDWVQPVTNYAGPAYSTLEDIDRPETLTPPRMCFPTPPTGLPKKTRPFWLDFTVIADERAAYMFFTDDGGNFLRTSTSPDQFPLGWSEPVVVMQKPTSVIFEGSCTYKLRGQDRYLTIIEAIAPQTRDRFYTSFIADRLDGDWQPLATTEERPFAGLNNVRGGDGGTPWSAHISHGEILRASFDEFMEIDPAQLRFLYQGWDKRTRVPNVPLGRFNGYHEIPWHLALLSAVTPPPLGEPTNAKEAASQNRKPNAITPEQQSAYEDLVSKLSPEEQAWERTLAENLGGFYFPAHQKDRLAGKVTAWNYVQDAPALPRVLIIGDSISRGYTLNVRQALAGKANVHRAPANCGPTANGLAKLDVWLGAEKWDLITFNFGIHDRKTPPDVYKANLQTLLERLRATGAKVLWVRTTPAPAGPNAEEFSDEQCAELNRVADELMLAAQIPAVDLCNLVQPRLQELQLPNNVHFNREGYEVMGQEVARIISLELPGTLNDAENL